AMRRQHGIASLGTALRAIHHPSDDADMAELKSGRSAAHHMLALDELFTFELAMCIERERSARRSGLSLDAKSKLSEAFVRDLGFELTRDQRTAIEEIRHDLESTRQMNRILIGDVGSGKTAVAFWAAIRAIESGAQVAMMAPTEILAEQHFAAFQRLCGPLRIESAILTGRTAAEQRRTIRDGLSRGVVPIVFGTQALIQEKVRIAKLGLGIIDEQHRFGVFDRARLKALGPEANVLMMTATPIPRSLAMVLFANLDVSILAAMPPGRVPIRTETFDASEIDRVDEAVAAEIAAGRRAYYVAPLIADNDDPDAEPSEPKSVEAAATRLKRGALRNARIATIHGRMRPADKDAAMRAFRAGDIDVLVSTTVIEVGIDVPEASAIVIVAAERYGLAQLHQLRGRVGRGGTPSRCLLVKSGGAEEKSSERLDVMTRCASGDQIAQADLDMRGPGDLLGARQSGALPLRYVSYVRDAATIRFAREMAEQWLASDPRLESPESQPARGGLKAMLALGFSLADVG
ncbi:MAG TPA: ATP-dependent DNA helicase RecG, partial [Candidatus Binataceae bacterium]|nr:ATP-dependent DNA helicase RecG [Candidatus Binataceae bacterium]